MNIGTLSTMPETPIPTLTRTSTTCERDRWLSGSLLRVRADGSDTDGRLSVVEAWMPRGFSPPLHIHRREDTAILVLDGTITVVVGDNRSIAEAGEFVWLPRCIPHTFRVDSDTARLIDLITPPGFEQFFVEASEPAPTLELPPPAEPEIRQVLATVEKYGAEIIGPPLALDDREERRARG